MRQAERVRETKIREGLEDALRRLTETGERLERFRERVEVLKRCNGNGSESCSSPPDEDSDPPPVVDGG